MGLPGDLRTGLHDIAADMLRLSMLLTEKADDLRRASTALHAAGRKQDAGDLIALAAKTNEHTGALRAMHDRVERLLNLEIREAESADRT
jgi:hypothetical protein